MIRQWNMQQNHGVLEMNQIEKNTVSAKRQMRENENVYFCVPENKGLRVMFVGNSITLHGVKEDIGWFNEWGMAASEKEKDYVHIMMSKIKERHSDAAFCICQGAEWERQYKNGENVYELYIAAREFGADVIIMRLVENCPQDNVDFPLFKQKYGDYIHYLSGDNNVKILLSTGFWHNALDGAIREFAGENALPLIELGDLGEDDSMKAIGLFEHEGVANHPGNLGMKIIADRLFEGLSQNDYL